MFGGQAIDFKRIFLVAIVAGSAAAMTSPLARAQVTQYPINISRPIAVPATTAWQAGASSRQQFPPLISSAFQPGPLVPVSNPQAAVTGGADWQSGFPVVGNGVPQHQPPMSTNANFFPTDPTIAPPAGQLGHACGSLNCCAPAVPECVPVCRRGCVYGGFEFLWMRAHFDQNVAMIIDPPVGNTMVPFDYGFELSPRARLGWRSCHGVGFRATYWQFDQAAAIETATAVPGATPVYLFVYGAGGNLTRNAYADLGETLISAHSLRLQSLDLELTQDFGLKCFRVRAGAGVRLAEMDQRLRGEVYDATNALWEIVTNDLTFQGVGPTVSLQCWRDLGPCSPIAAYAGIRGAFLFSDTRQEIYEMKDGYTTEVVDIADAREVISLGELSLGLQYTACGFAHTQFLARCSYETQAWFDVGGPVDSDSTVSLDGLALTLGLTY